MIFLAKRVLGVVGRLPYDPFEYCLLAAGSAIAWFCCIELTIVLFYTFRRRSGLYFWSLLISAWGCTFHALGFVLKYLTYAPSGAFLPFIEIGTAVVQSGRMLLRRTTGWVSMVTGQSFVLYSRLHLVVRKRLTLRLVLSMIIWHAITLHTPTIVLTIGSNGSNGSHWAPAYNIMERIQLTLFCIQESIISTIYIVYTVKLLGSIYHSRTRVVMYQLILINSICLGMDVVLICLEYTNNYVGETSMKPMLYAIKLKLELAVLNQLVGLTRAGFTEGSRRRGTHQGDHELFDRNRSTSSHHAAVPDRKIRIFRGSVSKGPTSPPPPVPADQICRTHHISIISEPKAQLNARASNMSTVQSHETRHDAARTKSGPLSKLPGLSHASSKTSSVELVRQDEAVTETSPSAKRDFF